MGWKDEKEVAVGLLCQLNYNSCFELTTLNLLEPTELCSWDPKLRQFQAFSVTAPRMMQGPFSVEVHWTELRVSYTNSIIRNSE